MPIIASAFIDNPLTLGVGEVSDRDYDKIYQSPDSAAPQSNKLQYARTRLARIKTMYAELTQKKTQKQRHNPILAARIYIHRRRRTYGASALYAYHRIVVHLGSAIRTKHNSKYYIRLVDMAKIRFFRNYATESCGKRATPPATETAMMKFKRFLLFLQKVMTDGITIRKATPDDIEAILEVYESARRYMRATGNLTQWSDGYPARRDVEADMAAGNCYVAEAEEGIVAAFAFIKGEDPTYRIIEDGAWLNDEPYGTIHRIASDGRRSGVLAACTEFCLARTENLRLDTHSDNRPMLAAVQRLGFIRCGVIFCRDGSPRTAFQKIRR